ncbi:four helix bundle protein [Capnocytophaga sp.]|uniref:four helix bundle protein n=1 Tax=Capnocytophaga sp. TaxID=44737 RepID=UPI0034C6161A
MLWIFTKSFPKEELFGITSQIRRASVSVPTNIAEGCGRESDKEFNYFLNISLGSASECEYLLLVSKDLNLINLESFSKLEKQVKNIKIKIHKLRKAIRTNIAKTDEVQKANGE